MPNGDITYGATPYQTYTVGGSIDRRAFEEKMIGLAAKNDEVIQMVSMLSKSPWRNLIQRSVFQLGQGAVRQFWRFHPGHGDRRGLNKWQQVQFSILGTDPTSDNSKNKFKAYRHTYGLTRHTYVGYETHRETPEFSLQDLQNSWRWEDVVRLILEMLPNITLEIWDNYFREMSLVMAASANRFFVLSNARYDTHKAVYDAFSVDADGDTIIKVPAGIEILPLNYGHLDDCARDLEVSCPTGGLAEVSGRQVIGLVGDSQEWNRMWEIDPLFRSAFLEANPNVFIDGYGSVKEFRSWAAMHEPLAIRATIKTRNDGQGNMILKVVEPYIDEKIQESGATYYNPDNRGDPTKGQGHRQKLNPEWVEAPFTVHIANIRDVYVVEIPPVAPMPAGTPSSWYGNTRPGFNGEWSYFNVRDPDRNRYGDLFRYICRMQAWARPGRNFEWATAFISLRRTLPQVYRLSEHELPVTDAVAVKAYALVPGSNTLALVTLAKNIGVAPGVACLFTYTPPNSNDAVTRTVTIQTETNAPTYKVLFAANERPAVNGIDWTKDVTLKKA